MKKSLLSTLVASLFATAAYSEIIGAVLVADDSECSSSHMIFSTNLGFINAEWFGGVFWEDRVYYANFHSFGMTDVLDEDGDEVGRIWVEDYWMSNSSASEFCYNR
jgi:hypothetical protein